MLPAVDSSKPFSLSPSLVWCKKFGIMSPKCVIALIMDSLSFGFGLLVIALILDTLSLGCGLLVIVLIMDSLSFGFGLLVIALIMDSLSFGFGLLVISLIWDPIILLIRGGVLALLYNDTRTT